jgi:dienelactone hydrolase
MPTTINIKSGEAMIPAEVSYPTGTPSGGVVVIAYGSDGLTDALNGPWASMIREYADELSRTGVATIIPDYFAKTGTKPRRPALEQIAIHVDTWQATVGDAITQAKTLSSVIASRVGLLGFSLGGHICLKLRAQAKVLVVFFAPELQGLGSASLSTLPAQVHHGLADNTVPFADAQRIDRLLRGEGATSELFPTTAQAMGLWETIQAIQRHARIRKNALSVALRKTCDTAAQRERSSGTPSILQPRGPLAAQVLRHRGASLQEPCSFGFQTAIYYTH